MPKLLFDPTNLLLVIQTVYMPYVFNDNSKSRATHACMCVVCGGGGGGGGGW